MVWNLGFEMQDLVFTRGSPSACPQRRLAKSRPVGMRGAEVSGSVPGYRVKGEEDKVKWFGVLGLGFEVWGRGFGNGVWVKGLGFRVWGSLNHRGSDMGYGVWDSGCRVPNGAPFIQQMGAHLFPKRLPPAKTSDVAA